MAQYDMQDVPGNIGGVWTVATSTHTLDSGSGVCLVVDTAVITSKAMLMQEIDTLRIACLDRPFPAAE